MNPKKILMLSLHSPVGEEYGATNRAKQFVHALQACSQLSLAIISYEPIDSVEQKKIQQKHSLLLTDQLKRSFISSVRDRLRYEFDGRNMNTHGFIVSAETRHTILRALDDYDIIIVRSIVLANALRIWSWPNTILDVDDLHSQIYWQQLKFEPNLLKKAKALRAFWHAKRRERSLTERFEGLIVCSKNDQKRLDNTKHIFTIPNAYAAPKASIKANAQSKRIGFIGLHTHKPNAQGLYWFVQNIWPLILKTLPNTELRVVGKHPPKWLADIKNITVLGYIDSIENEITTWNHTVVPILTGAGTRVKIATALACNLPVVSTPLGAYGYIEESEGHILLADNEAAFAAASIQLLENPEQHLKQQLKAEKYYQKNLSTAAINDKVAAMIHDFKPI